MNEKNKLAILTNYGEYLLPLATEIAGVEVKVNGVVYNGMLNIGYRPTVDGQNKKIEVHILDFSNDIYGKKIGITFVKKVRDEQKFESIQELKKQLEMDKQVILKILEKYK